MKKHYAVIGAGAFGGWTAYHLLKAGAKVTLLDPWGAGNTRASSGGESRIIRAVYGADGLYTKMVTKAFYLWETFEKIHQLKCYHQTGCLWLFSTADQQYMKEALPHLQAEGFKIEPLEVKDVARRFPTIETQDVQSAFWEPRAGWLSARWTCEQLAKIIVSLGGEFRRIQGMPGKINAKRMEVLKLSDGSSLKADAYIFACGPWLPKLFPALLKNQIQVSKQEVYFFSTPPGDKRYQYPKLPIWLDLGEAIFYGIPSHDNLRGFKVAYDMRLEAFDPDMDDRMISTERLQMVRDFLARRFPALANAPLQESRVCQYTNSADGHFMIDRHPDANNVWVVGAGSGHGYKLGPAVGAFTADLVLNNGTTAPEFVLNQERNDQRGFKQIITGE